MAIGDNKVSFSGRISKEIAEDIEEFASHLFSTKTAIMEEWLRLGREAFKKERPDIIKLIEDRKKTLEHSKEHVKKGDHRRSA